MDETAANRLIDLRFTRPRDPDVVLYGVVFASQTGWSPDPYLAAELRGPFIIEQRDLPDGPWVKVASATDGFATLVWDDIGYAPVTYDVEVDLGII